MMYRTSLALPLLLSVVRGIELDVNNESSIKSAASTLAGSIVNTYKQTLEGGSTDGAPGLFSDPHYWWQAGYTFNTLIEYAHLTGDKQYNDLIKEALVHQLGDYDAFMPPNQTKTLGNDDQANWGLASLSAAETGLEDPQQGKWVDFAKNVFDTQVSRWDAETCGGGLRWQIFTFNAGYEYKNSMSNGMFFLLSARLAKLTGNETYSEWASKSFDWVKTVGLVDKEWAVFDGTDADTDCATVNNFQWSANHGFFLEGAAVMYNVTDAADNWREAVAGFAEAGDVFLDNDVITEIACEGNGRCNVDQRAFKGMYARSYARAALFAPFVAETSTKILKASANAAAERCEGDAEDLECNLGWLEGDSEGNVGLGQTTNALQVVQGLLYSKSGVGNGNADGGDSANPSPSASGTPSGSAAPPEETGAAGKNGVAWAALVIAGAIAAICA